MKLTRAVLLFALVLASLHGRVTADGIDDLMRREISSHMIPGAALTIIQHGMIIKTGCYGLANLELEVPVTTNTVFEIGSVTKQFTATCILVLQQHARLSVEDRISRYLQNTPPTWSSITLRHLLTHTSGIKNYTGLDGFEWRRHLTQKQFISAIAEQPLDFAPGDSWKYSNSGYNLLGYIVENVTGTNYWQFLQDHVLQPIGMSTTRDRNPNVVIPNRAAGYEQTNRLQINRDYDLTDVFAAGGLVSTIGDLAKWSKSLDSNKILTEESKNLMWKRELLSGGKLTDYGFGWFIDTFKGHHVNGHGGSTSGFNASIQRFPDDELTVILLTNTDKMIATTLAREVAALQLGK